jgi:hypothetical protein
VNKTGKVYVRFFKCMAACFCHMSQSVSLQEQVLYLVKLLCFVVILSCYDNNRRYIRINESPVDYELFNSSYIFGKQNCRHNLNVLNV